ncbi:hypothetical protein [Phaeovulum sp.]|uniref:hypothetical protein n=1 Tax=Phaeovulum sp. TaxID=2934796 RepID=UPI003564679F
MVSRLTGVFLRAVLVALVVAMPALMLPGLGPDTRQITALIAVFGALLTFFEYASVYPGLVEFRDAPPFNRIRFIALLASVFLLTTLMLNTTDPTTLSRFVEATGAAVARSIDLPYSPVRLLVLMLPPDSSPEHISLVRTAAGLSYVISLTSLGFFVVILRTMGWPNSSGGFNVWVNLPTFDPTAGADVVTRLRRDAMLNVALGFLLPFLVPVAVKTAASVFEPISFTSPQTLIWTITAWAFLPASLFMRGIAMGRVAEMIEAQRQSGDRPKDVLARA